MDQRERADLDRHITGNYGKDQQEDAEQDINGPCKSVLKQHDAYAEPSSADPDFAVVRDAEGARLFIVTTEIKAADLLSLFLAREQVDQQAYQRGYTAGTAAAQMQMRAALGL